MANQIACINKIDRDDPYDRIDFIGGYNSSGEYFKVSVKDAIPKVESGQWEFFVEENGFRVDVIVAVSPHGNKYLKTEADDQSSNNLLSLPECS